MEARINTKSSDISSMYASWLWKKGARRRNWKLRYFLLHDNVIYYCMKECTSEHMNNVLGCIKLDDCQVMRADVETARPLSFKICHPDRRVFLLRARSESELELWLLNITLTIRTLRFPIRRSFWGTACLAGVESVKDDRHNGDNDGDTMQHVEAAKDKSQSTWYSTVGEDELRVTAPVIPIHTNTKTLQERRLELSEQADAEKEGWRRYKGSGNCCSQSLPLASNLFYWRRGSVDAPSSGYNRGGHLRRISPGFSSFSTRNDQFFSAVSSDEDQNSSCSEDESVAAVITADEALLAYNMSFEERGILLFEEGSKWDNYLGPDGETFVSSSKRESSDHGTDSTRVYLGWSELLVGRVYICLDANVVFVRLCVSEDARTVDINGRCYRIVVDDPHNSDINDDKAIASLKAIPQPFGATVTPSDTTNTSNHVCTRHPPIVPEISAEDADIDDVEIPVWLPVVRDKTVNRGTFGLGVS